MLGFVLVVAATIAIAAAVIAALAADGEVPEASFPPYWNELEEGELTEPQLRARLGAPSDVEDECLIYDDLVASQRYEFCFREGILFQKAAI